MSHRLRYLAALVPVLALGAYALQQGRPAAANRVTILYDAFGNTPGMKKDWGYSALIEYGGKRILFDTGNNPRIFAENVRTAGADLTRWAALSICREVVELHFTTKGTKVT